LFNLRLASPELAIARMRQRVREGGHNIPEPVIIRRFASGCAILKTSTNRWSMNGCFIRYWCAPAG